MNKLIFSGILGILISGSLNASAQHPGRYVRKPVSAPEFFIPSKEIEHQEKLPPFNVPEPVSSPAPAKASIEQIKYDEPEFKPEEPSQPAATSEEEFNPNLEITPIEGELQKNESSQATPKYKQEYAAYVQDLKAIAETGEAPHNQELDNDLAKMNNDRRLEVDTDGRIINPFQQSQLINPMALAQNTVPHAETETTKILDSVEIIRRPPQAFVEDEPQAVEADHKDNPFANTEERQPAAETESRPVIAPATPEAAAHFGGLNPFVDDTPEAPDYPAENDTQETESESELAPLPLIPNPNTEAEETPQDDFAIEPYQPEPQVSRSSSGGNRASGSSYTRSTNIVR